jgi:hypothetical protein
MITSISLISKNKNIKIPELRTCNSGILMFSFFELSRGILTPCYAPYGARFKVRGPQILQLKKAGLVRLLPARMKDRGPTQPARSNCASTSGSRTSTQRLAIFMPAMG